MTVIGAGILETRSAEAALHDACGCVVFVPSLKTVVFLPRHMEGKHTSHYFIGVVAFALSLLFVFVEDELATCNGIGMKSLAP